MKTMKVTHHQVALVHNASGDVVHTHEIVYHEGAAPISEADLHREALLGATSAHRHSGELTVRTSSATELEAHHEKIREGMALPSPRRSAE
jgi:hypothetical protein